MYRFILFCIVFLLSFNATFPGYQMEMESSRSYFIENKGQVIDQNGQPNPRIKFILIRPGYHILLREKGFSIEIYNRSGGEVSIHRVDIDFAVTNLYSDILANDLQPDYLNFYTTGTPAEGITGVKQYREIIYRNICPFPDFSFRIDGQGSFHFEYKDHSGMDPSMLQFCINGEKKYRELIQNLLSEEGFGDQDLLSLPRIWGSYFGGPDNEEGFGLAVTPDGTVYMTGETNSGINIATSGSYQVTIGGMMDAYIVKFDSSGNRLWATYFGGENNDIGRSISNCDQGNIYVAGLTWSTLQISTFGSFQAQLSGPSDGFLARFTSTGQRIWSTYFGGSDLETIYGCTSDSLGQVYIAGVTLSSDNISTPGAHQTTWGGEYDAFLEKFNPYGQRVWGTYYGGTVYDAGAACALDESGNIFLVGSTMSANNIATAGTHQTYPSGDYDAFLAKFTPDGQRLWGTYYGGINEDIGFSVAVLPGSSAILSGYTQSPANIATTGSQQSSLGGQTDAFLGRFDAAGLLVWGTYYGGSGIDGSYSCTKDDDGFIYLSGFTGSTENIATPDGFQPVPGGMTDAFLAKFNSAGQRQWGTYYGGGRNDYSYTLCCYDDWNVLIAGYTGSTDSIATPGAFQTTFGGGDRDAFLVRFQDIPVGFREQQPGKGITVYPDPNRGIFFIRSAMLDLPGWFLNIYNSRGSLVFSSNAGLSIKSNPLYIEMTNEPGPYLLYLMNFRNFEVQKFIVIR